MKARNKASYLFITFFLLLSIMASSVHAEVAFLPYDDYGTDRRTTSVASGDFNNDGNDDIVAMAREGQRLVILLASDDGSFTFKGLYGKNTNNHAFDRETLIVVDINNDGKLDIVSRNTSGVQKVAVFLGNGDGSFKQEIETTLPPYFDSRAFSVGDLDGDGNIDIVVAGYMFYWRTGVVSGGTIVFLFGNGEGGISSSKVIKDISPTPFHDINMGDVDKDGNMDMVLGNRPMQNRTPENFTYFTLLKGDGKGDFEAPVTYDSDVELGWVSNGHVRDVNNDGNLDIIVNPKGGKTIVFLGDGTGDFNERKESSISTSSYSALEDINCDGNLDIVISRAASQGVRIAVGSGDGTFALAAYYYNRARPHGVTVGDFNGDGKPDIATANWYPSGYYDNGGLHTTNDISVMLNSNSSCGPPITADAGPDQVMEQTSVAGAEVSLDGSGSEGDGLDYEWTWSGGSASGVNPTVLLPAGDTEVTLTVTSGSSTSTNTLTVTVEDTIPPSTSVLTSGTPGNNGWYVSTVNVLLLSDDSGSGVKEIHYSVNDGTEQVVAGSTASITIASDGPYSITYWAVDNAGNVEGAGITSGNIDKTAPETTPTYTGGILGNNGWYISDVSIALDAVDSGSVVLEIHYSVNGGTEQVVAGSTASITIASDGPYSITYWAVDNAGNEESQGSTSGKIDRTAPVITVTAPTAGDYFISDVLTIGFNTVETGSGLAYASATLDDQEVVNGQEIALYTLAPPGSHIFAVNSEDNAGNQASKTVTFNIKVTPASLSDVIDTLLASGEINNGGVANSLTQQLKNGNIDALLHHIDAQDGKKISGYAAELLRTAIASLD